MTGTGSDGLVSQNGQPANGWRRASLSLAGVIALILILYRDTTLYLAGLWAEIDGGPLGHGYLVLGISLYIVWHRRETLHALKPCPSPAALPVVAACVLVWLVASLADVRIGQVFILLPLILAGIWAIAGWRVLQQLLFPVMFIAFALPIWSPLLPLLRSLTAAAAFFLVRLSGITAYLQDYIVQLPSGQLHIESACSGLNYLLGALTLGVFYAWLNYRNYRSRLLVVMLAAAAALLANILRVFVIVYVAYVTDMQHPLVNDHLMLGWYLFGGLVLVLLFADHMINRRGVEPADISIRATDATEGGGCGYSHARRYLLLAVVAGLIVFGPATVWWVNDRPVMTPGIALELPSGQAGWSGPISTDDSWMPVYHGATEIRRAYTRDGAQVLLYIGYYPRQSQGGELINELNSISNSEIWQQTGAERRIASPDGQAMLEAELLYTDGQRRLVWYRYRVAGRNTTSRYVAKVLQVAGLLVGRRDAAIMAIAADQGRDINAVRQELGDFLASMEPALARIVDGQPDGQE